MRRIVDPTGHGKARPNAALIKLVARAHVFAQRQHGKDLSSVACLADVERINASHAPFCCGLPRWRPLSLRPSSVLGSPLDEPRTSSSATLDRDNRRTAHGHAVPERLSVPQCRLRGPQSPRSGGFWRGCPTDKNFLLKQYIKWRRGWDSNPRYALTAYNGLANRRLQPLGHPSAGVRLGLPPHGVCADASRAWVRVRQTAFYAGAATRMAKTAAP